MNHPDWGGTPLPTGIPRSDVSSYDTLNQHMKNLIYAGALLGAILAIGCSGGDPRTDTGGPAARTSGAAVNDEAKKGMDNASISQQIEKSRRLPNGQPLPPPPK